MGARGYSRTAWTDPKPGTLTAKALDMLKSGAHSTLDLKNAGLTDRHISYVFAYLQDQCGYVIQHWGDPNLDRSHHSHKGRYRHRYRITGRLAWRGGIAEDYTAQGAQA